MKIIVTRGTCAGGKRLAPSEKPVDVDKTDARLLVAYGHAVPFEAREDDVEVETRGKGKGKK